jgi:hypothetical protein
MKVSNEVEQVIRRRGGKMDRWQADQGATRLLRATGSGEWREFNKGVVVQCAESGIVLRESVHKLLLADIARSAVTGIVVVNSHLAALKLGNSGVALKFTSRAEFTSFLNVLQQWNLRIEHVTSQQIESQLAIPKLQDPEVQSLIVKLLFSEEFKGFAQDMKSFITGVQGSINK